MSSFFVWPGIMRNPHNKTGSATLEMAATFTATGRLANHLDGAGTLVMAMDLAATGALVTRREGSAALEMEMSLAASGELRALDFDVWWSMDESGGARADASGNGYHLDYNPYLVGSAPAKVGLGASFTAGSALVRGGASQPDHAADWSWFGWVKHEGTPAASETRLLEFSGPPATGVYFGFTSAGWKAQFYRSGYDEIAWSTPPAAGTWYFWTLTHNAATQLVSLHLNGVQVASGTLSEAIQGGQNVLQVGYPGGIGWLGDECGRSPQVLGQSQIQWLYNSGAGRSYSEI